jgi:hypothetical protein
MRLVDDDEYQNATLQAHLRDLLLIGAPLDELPDGDGPFGASPGNPIPVNGPIGELAYLSKLRTSAEERLLFHRLGSAAGSAAGSIDLYEAVNWSGSQWYLFYLDMYHPRRSRKAPDGFKIGGPSHFSGFGKACGNFPYDFPDHLAENQGILQVAYISPATTGKILGASSFAPPESHVTRRTAALESIMGSLR